MGSILHYYRQLGCMRSIAMLISMLMSDGKNDFVASSQVLVM